MGGSTAASDVAQKTTPWYLPRVAPHSQTVSPPGTCVFSSSMFTHTIRVCTEHMNTYSYIEIHKAPSLQTSHLLALCTFLQVKSQGTAPMHLQGSSGHTTYNYKEAYLYSAHQSAVQGRLQQRCGVARQADAKAEVTEKRPQRNQVKLCLNCLLTLPHT
jgi:hypothetical protein